MCRGGKAADLRVPSLQCAAAATRHRPAGGRERAVSLGDSSISVVVMAQTPADHDRLDRGLRQMTGEDARLHVLRDPQTGVGKPTTAGHVGLGRPDDDLS
jgi:hypothetical protein